MLTFILYRHLENLLQYITFGLQSENCLIRQIYFSVIL